MIINITIYHSKPGYCRVKSTRAQLDIDFNLEGSGMRTKPTKCSNSEERSQGFYRVLAKKNQLNFSCFGNICLKMIS